MFAAAPTPRASRPARDRVCNAAFTLVELLVVIGIIALLLGILLPVLNRGRIAGRQAVCLSNLRQLAYAGMMYATENRGFITTNSTTVDPARPNQEIVTIDGNTGPLTTFWNAGFVGDAGTWKVLHFDWKYGRISKYLKTPKIFICPSVDRAVLTNLYRQEWANYPQTNYGLAGINEKKMTDIRAPSETAIFADTMYVSKVLPGLFAESLGIGRPSGNSPSVFHGRHTLNRGCVAFFDGHAEPIVPTIRPSIHCYDAVSMYDFDPSDYDLYVVNHLGELMPPAYKVAETTSWDYEAAAKAKYDYYFWADKRRR